MEANSNKVFYPSKLTRLIASDRSIFKVGTVVDADTVVTAVHQSGLVAYTVNVIQ